MNRAPDDRFHDFLSIFAFIADIRTQVPIPAFRRARNNGLFGGRRQAARLSAQQQADAVDVEGDDGERHHAGKAIGSEGTNPVEAPMLQIVDS